VIELTEDDEDRVTIIFCHFCGDPNLITDIQKCFGGCGRWVCSECAMIVMGDGNNCYFFCPECVIEIQLRGNNN